MWATGSTSGLTATKIAERTSDFYALEAAYVLFAAMTVTGLLLVAFPRAGALPLRLPLSLAFVGSAALACWGGYMMLTALENRDPSRRISELMNSRTRRNSSPGCLSSPRGHTSSPSAPRSRAMVRRAWPARTQTSTQCQRTSGTTKQPFRACRDRDVSLSRPLAGLHGVNTRHHAHALRGAPQGSAIAQARSVARSTISQPGQPGQPEPSLR